jgi:hypothetical protein
MKFQSEVEAYNISIANIESFKSKVNYHFLSRQIIEIDINEINVMSRFIATIKTHDDGKFTYH